MVNHVGHDLNFVSLSGILSTILPKYGKSPVFPSVFIGDVSAAILCAFSISLALLNKAKGFDRYQVQLSDQIIDLSYAEAATYLSIFPRHLTKFGMLGTADSPGVLNGGAARYNFYQSKEGQWFALGALEQKFYLKFLEIFKMKEEDILRMTEQSQIEAIQAVFEKKSSADLMKLVRYTDQIQENGDLMLTPVLSFKENSYIHDNSRPFMVKVDSENQMLPATRIQACKVDGDELERPIHECGEREEDPYSRPAQQ